LKEVSVVSEADAGKEFAVSHLAKLDNRIDELEAELCDRNDRIQELENRVDVLEARTDLLSLVESSDEMDGMQRSVALLQQLQRKAEQEARRGRTESAAIDRDAAEEALHHPNLDRTTYYKDMRRAVRLVDDEAVCYYEDGEGRLVLNLEYGDVPARFETGKGQQ
jgi:predicted  nucleic acid-binding Zn-ribbon protein